jgi:antitoxin ParD1/3/4
MLTLKGVLTMAIATINISIPDNLKAEVEEIVSSEGYGNTSEFFRDLVRDYLKTRQERRLEALLLEGLESGKATPLTKADFAEIKRRGLERIKNKAK